MTGWTEVHDELAEALARFEKAEAAVLFPTGYAANLGTIAALVAGRHFEELEFHLRAALTNGLTREEIIEVLLQTSIYVGVPAANTAFAVANRVLNDGA